jgi:trimethylamine---corrinoid protein Co-methyltransferase
LKIINPAMLGVNVEIIHEATLYVLENVGVHFNSREAIGYFKKHGAKIDGSLVYINEKMLQENLKLVPDSFTIEAPDPSKRIVVGGGSRIYAPAFGALNVRDRKARRPAEQKDLVKLIKLMETSDVLHMVNPSIVVCSDLDPNNRSLIQTALCLKYSSKALIGVTAGKYEAEKNIELANKFFGTLEKHVLLGIINPITPLYYDQSMAEGIAVFAKNNQPIVIASCSLPGATSPGTLASTLVVNNAEILAGIVLSQLIKPGLPIIYGNASVACDMRYMSTAIGSPETALITCAAAELGSYYQIPVRSGGALTDAKVLDAQAGIESMMTMLPAILSGVDLILHSCGILESYLTVDFKKFLVDEEMIRMAERFARGIEIDEQKLGLDVIEKCGPGGNFISEEHTLFNLKSEFYYPRLFSRTNFYTWQGEDRPIVNRRAAMHIDERIEGFREADKTKEQEEILAKILGL